MIITQIVGGLGNQMFQYACGRAEALRTKEKLYLDISWYKSQSKDTRREFELSIFKTDFSIINEIIRKFLILPYHPLASIVPSQIMDRIRKTAGIQLIKEDPSKVKLIKISRYGRYLLLKGYWGNIKYFEDFKDQIIRDFSFSTKPHPTCIKYIDMINKSPAVSLHIRRGDYATNPSANTTHGLLPLSYYEAAINLIINRVSNAVFYIFSDDIEWAKSNLKSKSKLVFVEHTGPDWEDLRLMSLCQHHIIANSTFSWWGAWLNQNKDKIVVSPKKWFSDPAYILKEGMIPIGWTQL